MSLIRIICFLSFLFCFAAQPIKAMELSSLKQFSEEEINLIVKNHLDEIPQLLGLLVNQENMFELYHQFSCEQLEKTEYINQLNILEEMLLYISNSISNYPEQLKKFINPISSYIYLIKNQKNPLSFEQKISIIKNLYGKYQEIKNSYIVLIEQINMAYIRLTSFEQEELGTPKKNRYLISKEEFGINSCPDSHFVNIMHNICRTLEVQGNIAEVIVFIHQSLKEIALRLNKQIEYMQNGSLEINKNFENTPGESAYIIKKPKSIEAYYVSYIIGSLSKDPTVFEALEAFALSLINHQNSEIKNFAELALAKSAFDRVFNQYIRLVSIFYKIYNQDLVIRDLEGTYLQSSPNDPLKHFFPSALFEFVHLLREENIHFNETREFLGRLNSINNLIAITEKFLNEFEANKKTYATNYNRLKNTLRSLVPKCPSSQLYTMQRYLKECSLEPYCLDIVLKNHILDNEEIKLIAKLRQEIRQHAIDTSETVVNEKIPSKKQKNIKQVVHKKKKRSRRKNQKKSKANKEESPEKEEPTQQTDSQKIRLENKTIAREIIDIENDMTIWIYCLKDIDLAAGKLIIYDDRVEQWFSKPENALAEKGYAEDDQRRETSIPFHRFTKEVDRYALKWGFKRNRQNKHGKQVTEIYLPGVIEKKDGTSFTGLFVYVIDVKMLCYHRFFHRQDDWHGKPAEEWQVNFEE